MYFWTMRLEPLQSLPSVLKDSEFLVSHKFVFTMRNSLRLLEAFRLVALWRRDLILAVSDIEVFFSPVAMALKSFCLSSM
jgi:hypothetical protein